MSYPLVDRSVIIKKDPTCQKFSNTDIRKVARKVSRQDIEPLDTVEERVTAVARDFENRCPDEDFPRLWWERFNALLRHYRDCGHRPQHNLQNARAHRLLTEDASLANEAKLSVAQYRAGKRAIADGDLIEGIFEMLRRNTETAYYPDLLLAYRDVAQGRLTADNHRRVLERILNKSISPAAYRQRKKRVIDAAIACARKILGS
jgi:hypothetical protein